ncbi:TPA: trp operon leader peptide [Escherichia coli]
MTAIFVLKGWWRTS